MPPDPTVTTNKYSTGLELMPRGLSNSLPCGYFKLGIMGQDLQRLWHATPTRLFTEPTGTQCTLYIMV